MLEACILVISKFRVLRKFDFETVLYENEHSFIALKCLVSTEAYLIHLCQILAEVGSS
jgi:hypothetical protein